MTRFQEVYRNRAGGNQVGHDHRFKITGSYKRREQEVTRLVTTTSEFLSSYDSGIFGIE